MPGYPLGGASVVMTVVADVVDPFCIAEPAHLDVAPLAVAPKGSDRTRGGDHRPGSAVTDRLIQQRFPIERFEDLERWIVERSAKVRGEMAAQGATWTVPVRAAEGERRPA